MELLTLYVACTLAAGWASRKWYLTDKRWCLGMGVAATLLAGECAVFRIVDLRQEAARVPARQAIADARFVVTQVAPSMPDQAGFPPRWRYVATQKADQYRQICFVSDNPLPVGATVVDVSGASPLGVDPSWREIGLPNGEAWLYDSEGPGKVVTTNLKDLRLGVLTDSLPAGL